MEKSRPLKNYHTHTFRCKHAAGEVRDYAAAALEHNISVLGISDHTPLPDNRWLSVRMHRDELDGYLTAIATARNEFPGLAILAGLECDYFPEYHDYYKEELLGRYGLDYLIAGTHFFTVDGSFRGAHSGIMGRSELKAYTAATVKTIESGLFTFISHPDMFGMFYLQWDKEAEAAAREILGAAADNHIALELNTFGLRKNPVLSGGVERAVYPLPQFWELAAGYDIRVVVNSDAHSPAEVAEGIEPCLRQAAGWGLTAADFSYLET
jgi:histidinol-phosphatase (PHP family)